MKIVDHLLTEVEHLRCKKCSRLLQVVDTIVVHSTDGANAMSSAQYLSRPDTSVSAHIVIARSGQIIQLLPFNVRAWHAGVSEYAGRCGLNDYSVGIELDNAGKLHRRGDHFFSWFNKEYPSWEVYTGVEQGHAVYYHRYTREQIEKLVEVCRLLKEHYPIHWFVRHSDITKRKIDPGPALPFEEIRKETGL